MVAAVRMMCANLGLTVVCLTPKWAVGQDTLHPLVYSPFGDHALEFTLTYDVRNGGLAFTFPPEMLSTLILRSEGGRFEPGNVIGFDGAFDVRQSDQLARTDPGGFEGYYLGEVLPPSLTVDSLLGDLSLDAVGMAGSSVIHKYSRDGPFLYVVPEPSAVVLFIAGAMWLSIAGGCCRRSQPDA